MNDELNPKHIFIIHPANKIAFHSTYPPLKGFKCDIK